MTPKRKKQIRKVSTNSQSEHIPQKSKAPKPSKSTRMGRPENKDEENIFMEELKRCAPCINLELEIQVLVWLRYFRTRGAQQFIEGLKELYENAGCLEVYEALLRQDYLSLELSKEEEEKFTSNIDCQFMVHYMTKNGKTEWSSQELLMLILALLRWRKLVNAEVMEYFQRVLPRFERLPRTEEDLKNILEQVINQQLTQELLEKKLAALVNKLKEHMNLKEKPFGHMEMKKEEDVRLHEEEIGKYSAKNCESQYLMVDYSYTQQVIIEACATQRSFYFELYVNQAMNSQLLGQMQEEDEELRSIPTTPHQSEEALPDNEREPFNAEHYQLCLRRLLSDDYCAIEASSNPSRTISNLHLLQTCQRRGQRRRYAAPQRIYESAELRYTITNRSLSPSSAHRQTVPTLQQQPERAQQQLFTDPALLSMIRKDIRAINRNRNPSLLQ